MTDELKPQFTDDELTHMKGQEAEAFIRFFDEGTQYFKGVMADCLKEISDEILSLNPTQTQDFTILSAERGAIYRPLMRVRQDIQAGKAAWMRINGVVDKTEGIL